MSSVEEEQPMMLEPAITMHEEPGEVNLNSDIHHRTFFDNGDIPAQISITRVNPGPRAIRMPPYKSKQALKPKPNLAGIVPKGLRPVNVRPPPLIRGGFPPPPRLRFGGLPSNIRPVNRQSSNNPFMGMIDVTKKIGNSPKIEPRLCHTPGPTPNQMKHLSQGFSQNSVVTGLKNISPVSSAVSKPPPMIRPGFRPVNVRPNVVKSVIISPPVSTKIVNSPSIERTPELSKPSTSKELLGQLKSSISKELTVSELKKPIISKEQTAESQKLFTSKERVPELQKSFNERAPQIIKASSHRGPSPKDKNSSSPKKERVHDFSKTPKPFQLENKRTDLIIAKQNDKREDCSNKKEALSVKESISDPPATLQENIVKEDTEKNKKEEGEEKDQGATKFRFVRRADGKGFIKKSCDNTPTISKSSALLAPFRSAYSSPLVKGIRKKKKKPFRGINYRFDGTSVRKKKKAQLSTSRDDDEDSLRSEPYDDDDVLAYLGIQRKDSSDSKGSNVEELPEKSFMGFTNFTNLENLKIEETREGLVPGINATESKKSTTDPSQEPAEVILTNLKESNNEKVSELPASKDKSSNSKESGLQRVRQKVITGPKAKKSFKTSAKKRHLEDILSNGTPKKTRFFSPKVGQFFPLPSANTPRVTPGSSSTSISCSEEETIQSIKTENSASKEALEASSKSNSINGESTRVTRPSKSNLTRPLQVSYSCECDKSLVDIHLRRNSSTNCRAIESVGGSRVGCKNSVKDFTPLRPDARLPGKVFCDLHIQRLRAHQACCFCGEFCSHGIFFMCRPSKAYTPHIFHRSCYKKAKVKACCHCGSENEPVSVQLSVKMDRAPIQLLRSVSKMSFIEGKKDRPTSDEDLTKKDEDVITYKMANGKVITSEGLPPGIENAALQKVLNALEDKQAPKHATRNMYLPTKSGDSLKIMQLLSLGYPPNQKFGEFRNGTPLHVSASEGHVLNCHILVQAGGELDSVDDNGNTPLHLASAKGRFDVVRYLLQAGADLTLRGEDGMTCLHLAAQNGHMECAQVIMSQSNLPKNYLNLQDEGGWTPLVWACENKHEKVTRYLLSRGSNPLLIDSEGNIALHWASLSGSRSTCELLINNGCDVNAKNMIGDTPIHIALRQDHYECAVLLLMRGAKINVRNKNGQLPSDCMSTRDSKCRIVMRLSTTLEAMMKNTKKYFHEWIVTNDVTKGKEICPIQCINGVDDAGTPGNYVYVRNNCVTSSIPINRNLASLQHCKCEDTCSSEDTCRCSDLSVKSWYDLDGKLKDDFEFKEPPMIFECNDMCSCNVSSCHNRVVQHGITARMTVFRTEGMGWGVRALKDIPKGSFVCEYVGEIISDSEADTREDSYLFDLDNRDGETFCIDANKFGNIARFINHSCSPNLTPVKVFAEHQDLRFPHIALFANRDIQKGVELGFDYGEKFWVIKHKYFTCHCGSEKCHYSKSTIQTFLKDYYRRFPKERDGYEENETKDEIISNGLSDGENPPHSLKKQPCKIHNTQEKLPEPIVNGGRPRRSVTSKSSESPTNTPSPPTSTASTK